MTIRLLATGDIHIGRRPTRVPDPELAERASAARMWESIAARAITERVDAVMLSGDIVDHDNRFYEATGPLERGILSLADAGIPTFAVAGNHDWDVFPRVLEQLNTPLFHLLGRNGRWEETYLERDGERLLRIVGWSFPSRHVRHSPLREFQAKSEPGLPTVGLLHADVDVPDSDYSPVKLSELQARDVGMWVLGHNHKPQLWPSDTGANVLYPGSPQALDPGEPGRHGPWLIEIESPRSFSCRHVPMSRVRYEACEVDLDGAEDSDEFDRRIQDAISNALREVVDGDELPQLLSLRLNITGATPLCGRIDSMARHLDELERSHSDVRACVDKFVNLTRPEVNLDDLSRRNDPVGTLARILATLEIGEADSAMGRLLDKATARMRDVHCAAAFVALIEHQRPPDRNAARQALLQQGRRLLEALRDQVPEAQERSG